MFNMFCIFDVCGAIGLLLQLNTKAKGEFLTSCLDGGLSSMVGGDYFYSYTWEEETMNGV